MVYAAAVVARSHPFLDRADDAPTDDQIVVLEGVSWADFQRILEIRGKAAARGIGSSGASFGVTRCDL